MESQQCREWKVSGADSVSIDYPKTTNRDYTETTLLPPTSPALRKEEEEEVTESVYSEGLCKVCGLTELTEAMFTDVSFVETYDGEIIMRNYGVETDILGDCICCETCGKHPRAGSETTCIRCLLIEHPTLIEGFTYGLPAALKVFSRDADDFAARLALARRSSESTSGGRF